MKITERQAFIHSHHDRQIVLGSGSKMALAQDIELRQKDGQLDIPSRLTQSAFQKAQKLNIFRQICADERSSQHSADDSIPACTLLASDLFYYTSTGPLCKPPKLLLRIPLTALLFISLEIVLQ